MQDTRELRNIEAGKLISSPATERDIGMEVIEPPGLSVTQAARSSL